MLIYYDPCALVTHRHRCTVLLALVPGGTHGEVLLTSQDTAHALGPLSTGGETRRGRSDTCPQAPPRASAHASPAHWLTAKGRKVRETGELQTPPRSPSQAGATQLTRFPGKETIRRNRRYTHTSLGAFCV